MNILSTNWMATETTSASTVAISIPVAASVVGSREKRLENDKETLFSYCNACHFVSVKSPGSSTSLAESSSISLEFTSGEKKTEFTFLYSTDYPSGTVVTSSVDPGAVKSYDQPLSNIFIDICKEWCKDHEIPLPPELTATNSSLPSSTPFSPQLSTQISIASSIADSELTDCSDVDYFDDGMMDDDDDEDFVNPLILKDIELIKKLHGDNCIEHKLHAGINEMDILLYIDMGFLDEHTASAWGVDSSIPIVLHFHFQSASEYLDGPEPKVEVYQSSVSSKEKRKFGLGTQIQKIVETFISTNWRSTSNYHLKQEYEKVTSTDQSKATPTNTPPSSIPDESNNSHKLLLMGFSPSSVRQALVMCGEKIERAIHLLTTGELIDEEEEEEEKGKGLEEEVVKENSFRRQDSQGARATVSLHHSIEDVKIQPSLENGFLCQLMKYTLNRIPSLNEFCVICDERHVLETGLLRPCVCTRELCVFAFQTLGVMADAAESVATDASVVDLLIAMCNAATNSNRASLILDPFPSIVDPSNPHRLAMDPSTKDFNQAKVVMTAIIAGREELLRGRCTHSSLKAVLDSHHTLAFPLMQWIVATNRAYIVMLPEDRQLRSMDTKYQFLLISSPPAKEMAFQQAKLKHGSTFAFHGSSIENWHSIMRKGLINASGTKYQLNGAAYGSGIYLSPNASTSFGYSNRYYYNPSSQKKGSSGKQLETLAGKLNITCIALCEVVTSKELKRSGDIWVCSNSEHVVTRFFFVYDTNSATSEASSLHTESNRAFKQEIMHAVALAKKMKLDNSTTSKTK